MAIPLNDNIEVQANKPSDPRFGPWSSVDDANDKVEQIFRHTGLTVGIIIGGETVEYWYKEGTTNSDLVEKSSGGGGITGWLANTSYKAGQNFTRNGCIYLTNIDFTSGTDFVADYNTTATTATPNFTLISEGRKIVIRNMDNTTTAGVGKVLDLSVGNYFDLTTSVAISDLEHTNALIGHSYTFLIRRGVGVPAYLFKAGKFTTAYNTLPVASDTATAGVVDMVTAYCIEPGRLVLSFLPNLMNN